MLLPLITGDQWVPGQDLQEPICLHLIKWLPYILDKSEVFFSCVVFPVKDLDLKEAKKHISDFCMAYTFLLQLYGALTPMELGFDVSMRKDLWVSYQWTIYNLLHSSAQWPKVGFTPDNNILEELQSIMDADYRIKHLKLNAAALSTPDHKSISRNKAADVLSRMMSKCFDEIKATPFNIDDVLAKIHKDKYVCLPVTDLTRLLAVSCHLIAVSVENHIRANQDEYDQAVEHLVSLASA